MKITDKLAFEDAQIMARIAVGKFDGAFWFAAMQALKAAYNAEIAKLLSEGWTEYGAGWPPVDYCEVTCVNDKGRYRRFGRANHV